MGSISILLNYWAILQTKQFCGEGETAKGSKFPSQMSIISQNTSYLVQKYGAGSQKLSTDSLQFNYRKYIKAN